MSNIGIGSILIDELDNGTMGHGLITSNCLTVQFNMIIRIGLDVQSNFFANSRFVENGNLILSSLIVQ